MELETYRVFTAEQDFKYTSDTFLQAHARAWLSRVLMQPIPDEPLATLLQSGSILSSGTMKALRSAAQRLTPADFGERHYAAIHNDIIRFQEACKALGLQLDDVVAVCDIVAAKTVTATCHALWSVASACVAAGMQGVPEFVTKSQLVQLRATAMSRTRSSEKALKLHSAMEHVLHKAAPQALALDCVPAVAPGDIDSANTSPVGKEGSAAVCFVLPDVAAPPFDCRTPALEALPPPAAAQTSPASRPRSAGAAAGAGSRASLLPKGGAGRPASAPAARVPKLALKLPLPAEVTRQSWAVDACRYQGLPLRPQPVLRIRSRRDTAPPKKMRAVAAVLARANDALPLAGSLLSFGAVIFLGCRGAAPAGRKGPGKVEEEALWVVGKA